MPVELTEETRVRGHVEAERSEKLRPLVLEAIEQHSGQGSPLEIESAREQFLRFCIIAAESRGIQLWKSAYMTTLQSAQNSLSTLLGEKRTSNGKGTWSTGVNKRWVLDVWEAGLEQFYSSRVEEELVPISLSDYRRSTCVLGEKKELFPKTLATRVLEAYHARDDEKIAELWVEIIQLEKKAA